MLRGFRPHDPVCPPGAGVPLRLPWMEEAMADPRLVLKIAHVLYVRIVRDVAKHGDKLQRDSSTGYASKCVRPYATTTIKYYKYTVKPESVPVKLLDACRCLIHTSRVVVCVVNR